MTPIAPASYTPEGLTFDEPTHVYRLADGTRLLSVTSILRDAGLVDLAWYTPADRQRGTLVHTAIARQLAGRPLGLFVENAPIVVPYLGAFARFLTESGFRVDACEERVADVGLRVAGTLDLRGTFPDSTAIDVIDVKSGQAPPWVGYQLAGYARLLPPEARRHVRRWCLHLRDDGTYSLLPLRRHADAAIFLAAVVVAQARAGWLA
jgi:hypothetical protein